MAALTEETQDPGKGLHGRFIKSSIFLAVLPSAFSKNMRFGRDGSKPRRDACADSRIGRLKLQTSSPEVLIGT